MLFNSLGFLFFFPIITTIYFVLPHKYRWQLLLAASCFFYMCFIPEYILILIITIVIDYIAGILIEKSSGNNKKIYLVISIVSTCLVLFIFKYFNFFNMNFAVIASFLNLNYPIKALEIILPIGLSFHTFQSLSYIIEVFKGKQKAEKNFGIYALYVMFYPQLVAGPIERPQNLLHQFYQEHFFDYKRVTEGLKLMAWGMFKKVVIADRLAVLVNQVYGEPTLYNGAALTLATVFFAFQIYCDFSGYSDIAIGSAQVMGFKLMKNFERPYLSKSISEFWKRWHISLSTWFRDYVYVSLGGNRCHKWRWYFNLFITFLISGFWHGANWTYVVWGGLNGFYLVFAIWTEDFRSKICTFIVGNNHTSVLKYWQTFVTFLLICFSWIFFRANNIDDAIYIITHLFTGWGNILRGFESQGLTEGFRQKNVFGAYVGLGIKELSIAFLMLILLNIIHLLQKQYSVRDLISARTKLFRFACYYAVVLLMVFLGVYGENQFIYFQF